MGEKIIHDAATAARAVPRTVRLDEIRAADWNVHQTKDEALAGLAASMRANGLIQRVIVRASSNVDSIGSTPRRTGRWQNERYQY